MNKVKSHQILQSLENYHSKQPTRHTGESRYPEHLAIRALTIRTAHVAGFLDSGLSRNDGRKKLFRGKVFVQGLLAPGRQSGFTLLEIMVSLVLIGLVVVSVIQLSSANLRNLSISGDRIELLERANGKMREVLDSDLSQDKTWQDVDDEGFTYDISVVEAIKDRTEALPVKFLEITVSVQDSNHKPSKRTTLNTAKMISKSDALKSQ